MKLSIRSTGSFATILFFVFSVVACNFLREKNSIDRYALVNRHNIEVHKIDTLASLSVGNGNFAFTTDITGLQTFFRENPHRLHLGIIRNTLKLIMERWNWSSTWGWDYPMVAMCATRLLEPEMALDALMMDVQKNTCLLNGHNFQDGRLRLYLPGNGGLLKAVALMCAGWEGCTIDTPGFPKDGSWNVRWENLNPDL